MRTSVARLYHNLISQKLGEEKLDTNKKGINTTKFPLIQFL